LNPPDILPGQPVDDTGTPVFAEPWQAKAFALTVLLHHRGAFTWPEWAAALAAECADDPSEAALQDSNSAYYQAWLRALQSLLAANGITALDEITALSEAWQRAALATPHGTPIRLENAPRGD
jgi:nitrile hydratase accessory protein